MCVFVLHVCLCALVDMFVNLIAVWPSVLCFSNCVLFLGVCFFMLVSIAFVG